jgi:hypothetical protein
VKVQAISDRPMPLTAMIAPTRMVLMIKAMLLAVSE